MITIHNGDFPVAISGNEIIIGVIFSLLITATFYVLRSIGLYSLAKRANLDKKIFAVLPFLWIYTACKLIGKANLFGKTYEKLALLICIIFSVAGALEFVYNFLVYFPIVGNVLFFGREIVVFYGELLPDMSGFVETHLQGVYGIKGSYVDPYGNSAVLIYKTMHYLERVLSILDFAVIVINICVYFNLFKKYWPQHHLLCGFLSLLGLFGVFVFVIRKKQPVKYEDYLRSRFGAYGPTRFYGNPYGNPYGNQYGDPRAQGPYQPQREPEQSPFEEFDGEKRKDRGNPFKEFDD